MPFPRMTRPMADRAADRAVRLVEIPAPARAFRDIVESGDMWAPVVNRSPAAAPGDAGWRARGLPQLRQALRLAPFVVTDAPELKGDLLRFGFPDVRVRGGDPLDSSLADGTKTMSVVGPAVGSYSLAIVNRGLARAVSAHDGWTARLLPHTGLEPDARDPDFLWDHPEIRSLLGSVPARADVAVGNAWPPPIDALRGHRRWLYFYWEESRLPEGLPERMRVLDGILAPSEFVRRVLVDSGFPGPVPVVGTGVSVPRSAARAHIRRAARRDESFTFLHVSSGMARKGVDVLLRAYGAAFSSSDAVRLVLRVPGGPETDRALDEFRRSREHAPDVRLVADDLTEARYYALFEHADCFVSATRGEGFGLPPAEAMLHRMPVIITGFGGHTDFCTPETSLLVDYRLAPARTHFGVEASMWAEPDAEHLADVMRSAFDDRASQAMARMTERAAREVSRRYSWSAVADRVVSAVEEELARPATGAQARLDGGASDATV